MSGKKKREEFLLLTLIDLRGHADKLDCYKTRDKIDEALREVGVELASVRTARMRSIKD